MILFDAHMEMLRVTCTNKNVLSSHVKYLLVRRKSAYFTSEMSLNGVFRFLSLCHSVIFHQQLVSDEWVIPIPNRQYKSRADWFTALYINLSNFLLIGSEQMCHIQWWQPGWLQKVWRFIQLQDGWSGSWCWGSERQLCLHQVTHWHAGERSDWTRSQK